jgi:hypothetical protein
MKGVNKIRGGCPLSGQWHAFAPSASHLHLQLTPKPAAAACPTVSGVSAISAVAPSCMESTCLKANSSNDSLPLRSVSRVFKRLPAVR